MDSNFAKVWTLHEGAEIEIPLNELEAQDIVVLHGGDLVLIEGTVVNGQGIVRQYSLQKKLKSVPKQSGDRVFPFTQLESGCLYIQRG
jgi:Cu2+-exporting ATPase